MAQLPEVGLNLLLGPMRSGKTAELLRLMDIRKENTTVYRRLLLRPSQNTRESLVSSRNGNNQTALTLHTLDDLEMVRSWIEANLSAETRLYIGLDEGHMGPFLPELEILVRHYNAKYPRYRGIRLIAACLNSKFDRSSWPSVVAVQHLAATIRMFCGICERCDNAAASFNYLPLKYQAQLSAEGTFIGDQEYKSVCEQCWVLLTEPDDLQCELDSVAKCTTP